MSQSVRLEVGLVLNENNRKKAHEIYEHLLRNCADEFEQERVTNLVACAAMIGQYLLNIFFSEILERKYENF